MCWGVERYEERDRRVSGVWGEARRDEGKCVGVCGEVIGDVRRGVGGGVRRGVEDAVECGGCGKVC